MAGSFGVRVDNKINEYVPTRAIPLPHLLITATSSGAAQTFYTVRATTMLRTKALRAANITGSAATISIHTIPSGDSIGNSNAEMLAVSIPANTVADLTDYVGGLYAEGTAIKVYAGTGSAIVLHGWGEEVL